MLCLLRCLRKLHLVGHFRAWPAATGRSAPPTHTAAGPILFACCLFFDGCAVGIEMAQKDKVDWLLHVDTDEMIYPSGSPAFSLQVRCRACPARSACLHAL